MYIEENKEMTFEQKLHKERDNVVTFCSKFQKIYLYGAGFVAELFLRYLQEEDVDLEGIIISDGEKTQKDFLETVPIYELSDIKLDNQSGIIIAIGKKNTQISIVDNLKQIGVSADNILMNSIYLSVEEYPELRVERRTHGYFSKYISLDKIGLFYQTDKCSDGHNYLQKYEFFLEKWKNEDITLLELGVYKGASIKMWGEYFKNAKIYGVDIDSDAKQYEGDNRIVLIKDLSLKDNLVELRTLNPTIIIDDASHFWSHQIKSFHYLFTCLPHGGIFIMEDLNTSFGEFVNTMYGDSVISAYDFFSALAEMVVSKGGARVDIGDLEEEVRFLANEIEMISISSENCIVIKK